MNKILNKTLSVKTSELIESITSNFKKEVIFKPIELLNIGGYGAADYWSENCYTIYLKEDLPKEAFETNILHELFHIQQLEEGYPSIRNITSNGYPDTEYTSFIGRIIQATILDLDVELRLNSHGYNSAFFVNRRYKTLKSINSKKIHFNDRFEKEPFDIQFILFNLLSKQSQKDFIIPYLNNQFPGLVDNALELSDKISEIGYNTPEKCTKCFTIIFDFYNLWENHCISINNQIITK